MSEPDDSTGRNMRYLIFGCVCLLVATQPPHVRQVWLIMVGICAAGGGLSALLKEWRDENEDRWRLDATKEGESPYIELFSSKHAREMKARRLTRQGWNVIRSINTQRPAQKRRRATRDGDAG